MSKDSQVIEHPTFGAAIPKRGWVPAPTYVLRRQRILHHLRGLAPGRLLEIGCGAGAMLADATKMGFRCDALETSNEARKLARMINGADAAVAVHQDVGADWGGAFDILLAMEVLEHIEDDAAALRQWQDWLRPGGTLLISVPAHPKLWNASDVWAGHFRRYSRNGLRQVIEAAGFEVEKIECYGFPLSNIIEPVRARVHARRLQDERDMPDADARAHGSARSGVERGIETRLYRLQASWPGVLAMRLFFALQYAFLRTDFGTGYILRGRKAK